jgi:uridine kinase
LRQNGTFISKFSVLDWRTDKYEIERNFSFNQKTVVIFEGVFLFRKELSPYIDYKIFIEISFEESKRRALLRDPHISEVDLRKYDEKYLPAQSRYLREYPPSDVADLIIDNSNWEYPVISYVRQPE